ncbi:uncharacterized protein [Pleurodeles waltl]|uniref:uncharacterized protein n=1 Tax=Pleurodeles waltl TaxID=8319 RepID=UPI0037094C94
MVLTDEDTGNFMDQKKQKGAAENLFDKKRKLTEENAKENRKILEMFTTLLAKRSRSHIDICQSQGSMNASEVTETTEKTDSTTLPDVLQKVDLDELTERQVIVQAVESAAVSAVLLKKFGISDSRCLDVDNSLKNDLPKVDTYFERPKSHQLAQFFQNHPIQPTQNLPFDGRLAFWRKDEGRRHWLTYSKIQKALFCSVCLAFSRSGDSGPFLIGMKNWKHVYQRIEEHEKSKHHHRCTQSYVMAFSHVNINSVSFNQRIVPSGELNMIAPKETPLNDLEGSQVMDDPKTLEKFFERPRADQLCQFFQRHPIQPSTDLPFNGRLTFWRKDGSRRSWLSYSQVQKAMFCSVCLVFSKTGRKCPFVYGMKRWKHVHQRIEEHEKSKHHLRCTEFQKKVFSVVDISNPLFPQHSLMCTEAIKTEPEDSPQIDPEDSPDVGDPPKLETLFERPSLDQLSQFFRHHPVQPSENLPFNEQLAFWRKDGSRRDWLSYSFVHEALFCSFCLAFSTNRESGPFLTGMRSWKHVYQRIEEHEKSNHHQHCVESFRMPSYVNLSSLHLQDLACTEPSLNSPEECPEIMKVIVDV